MLVLINAMKSISRSIGRNVLIGIIVLSISVSSCVALAIRNAASEAETAGIDMVNITGTITVDRQKLMEAAIGNSGGQGGRPDMSGMRELMSKYQDLSLSELQTYAQSDYVKNFYYQSSISLNASGDLEPYSTQTSGNSNSGSANNSNRTDNGTPGGGMGGGFTMGDFTVTGYSSEDAMTKFINGTAKITDGEVFDVSSSDMKCLISSELAAFNGLSVGDTIVLANPNAEDETYTLTIAGIYTDSSSGESGNQMRFSTSMDPANLICISYGSLQTIKDYSASVAKTETNDYGMETTTAIRDQFTGTFVFSNLENYNLFGEELRTKGLSEYYTLSSTDINNYEASLLPLKNLSRFAATMLIVILAIGAVILIVINVFNIRERKYEVGVLTAIGIKKSKVALQFVMELLCVTLLFIVIGAGVGAAVSVPVSNSLLSSQIEQMQSKSSAQNENFGRPDRPGDMDGNMPQMGGGRWSMGGSMLSVFSGNQGKVNYLDKINATVNFRVIAQLIVIGIVLTIISSLAAVIFVMRYEPLKILANRT